MSLAPLFPHSSTGKYHRKQPHELHREPVRAWVWNGTLDGEQRLRGIQERTWAERSIAGTLIIHDITTRAKPAIAQVGDVLVLEDGALRVMTRRAFTEMYQPA